MRLDSDGRATRLTAINARWASSIGRRAGRNAPRRRAASRLPRWRLLNADVRAWINTWNDDPKPFVWTKTADQILDSLARYCTRINESRH